MMMQNHKAKMATVIVNGMKKPDFVQKLGEEGPADNIKPEKPESDSEMAAQTAMKAFMDAMKGDDAKAALSSMKDLMDLIEDQPSDTKEGDEE